MVDRIPTSEPFDLDWANALNVEPVIPELTSQIEDDARGELLEQFEAHDWSISERVLDDIVGWHGGQLARLTNMVVMQRFSAFRMVLNPLWRPKPAPPGDAPAGSTRSVLDSYIAWERIERVLSKQGPYPELGRLVALTRENWLEAVTEMLDRIERDRCDLAQLVGSERAGLDRLTGVRLGISDPHMGGRSAAVLSFGGRKVVYKPRALEGEVAWSALYRWVLEEGLQLSGRSVATLRRPGYGYMEFIEHKPCCDRGSVEECFRRYGALLATAHAIGAADLHHENVIVDGAHPVVVDAEPLFRARLALSSAGETRLSFERNLSLEGLEARESVLELAVLPLTMQTALKPEVGGRREYEIGALCPYGMRPIEDLIPCGRASDELQYRPVPLVAKDFPNLPECDGGVQLPELFADAVFAGFEAGYELLCRKKEEGTRQGGTLDKLMNTPVRLLARPTMDYALVLARSLSPEPMTSTQRRVELINRDLQCLGEMRFDDIGSLLPYEAASLMAGDIPRFELLGSACSCGPSELMSAPIENARARWSQLDEFDRTLQIATIRERLQPNVPPRSRPGADRLHTAGERCAFHAYEMASDIARVAQSRSEGVYWVYASYAPGFGATMAHCDIDSLYEGAAGTAVLLAEAGRAFSEATWQQAAVRAFQPIVDGRSPASASRSGGLGRGLGGLIYAMLRVADATGAGQLVEAAVRLADEHGRRLAEQDELDEVLYGRSGLLLAMLALHERSPDRRVLRVADVAAAALLKRGVSDDRGFCWPVPGGQPMANCSHGTSGIALALARWAGLRGSAEAAAVARGALSFDDTFWEKSEKGWLDSRLDASSQGRTSWSWCNGRAGALLARLAVSEALGQEFEVGHVPEALTAEAGDVLEEVSPGLCCGTPGVVDALLKIGSMKPTPEVTRTTDRAVELITGEVPASHYSTLTCSLFAGTAGLAMALLRAARPKEVPSLLWFG